MNEIMIGWACSSMAKPNKYIHNSDRETIRSMAPG
jgi:hypothetical protein